MSHVALENDLASFERIFFDMLLVMCLGVGGWALVALAKLDTEL